MSDQANESRLPVIEEIAERADGPDGRGHVLGQIVATYTEEVHHPRDITGTQRECFPKLFTHTRYQDSCK